MKPHNFCQTFDNPFRAPLFMTDCDELFHMTNRMLLLKGRVNYDHRNCAKSTDSKAFTW